MVLRRHALVRKLRRCCVCTQGGFMLEEKILSDYKEAMKSGNKLKSSVLSFLRADMMNAAVSKKKNSLDDSEAIVVIKKQINTRYNNNKDF